MDSPPNETTNSPLSSKQWPGKAPTDVMNDSFPWQLVLRWLIPGSVGIFLLLAVYLFLQTKANRQIVFLTPQNQLALVPATGNSDELVILTKYKISEETRRQMQERIPLLGIPQWSPSGRYYATTLEIDNKLQVGLFTANAITPTLITPSSSNLVAMPTNAWSPDSKYAALIEHDGNRPYILLIKVAEPKIIPFDLELDIQAGIDWHPASQELLITAQTENLTPTLQVIDIDGNTRELIFQDDSKGRADGVWHPNGQTIAYVALTNTDGPPIGQIWLADTNNKTAKVLVAEGLNSTPIWSSNGEFLFFTRFLTQTNSFDLYRVESDGTNLQQIAENSYNLLLYPFDRQLFIDWSSNNNHLFFFSNRQIYIANEGGTEKQGLPELCPNALPVTVRWAPTNRALLITCTSHRMVLHWIDKERPNIEFPNGQWPSWQP